MRHIVCLCAIAGILLSPTAVRAQIDRPEYTRWIWKSELCGYYYRARVSAGIAHWLDGFLELKDVMLRHAVERGATVEQIKKLEEEFERGQKYAVRDGFTGEDRTEPKSEEILKISKEISERLISRCVDWTSEFPK